MSIDTLKTTNNNPAKYLTTTEQKESLASLTDIKDGLLYTMNYTADYKLDDVIDASLPNIPSFVDYNLPCKALRK